MAPITARTDRSKDLTTYLCSGQISVDEILSALKEYFSGEVTKNVLWDFAEADVDMHQPQIDRLMIYLRRLPPQELEKRRGGRVAIIAPKEYVIGIMETETLPVGSAMLIPHIHTALAVTTLQQ